MVLLPIAKKKFGRHPIRGIIILFIIFALLSFISLTLVFNKSAEQRTLNIRRPLMVKVKINQKLIKAELVSTPRAQYEGLSNRSYLCPNCGMLFNFSSSKEREFVMRNMRFPLDIIFINNQHIIKISANLAPAGARPKIIYKSGGPANQVLELNANYSAKQGIKVGDEVSIQP